MSEITIQQIEKKMHSKIKAKFKNNISKFISDHEAQRLIKKSLEYNLSDLDRKKLYSIGLQTSKNYPGLYWLCCIFIHPLTPLQTLANKVEKLTKI